MSAPLRDGCPTCGKFEMIFAGEVFMCTDDWHLLRCVCGKPAVRYLMGGIPTCGRRPMTPDRKDTSAPCGCHWFGSLWVRCERHRLWAEGWRGR